MNWSKITILFTSIAVGVVTVYDVMAMLNGGPGATLSYLIITASYDYPIIPFCAGLLAGHLWWRMPGIDKK